MGDWLNGESLKNWMGPGNVSPPERKAAPKAPDGVIYYPIRCPHCKSKNIRTHTTGPDGPNRRRYHWCKDCKRNFHSTEAAPPE